MFGIFFSVDSELEERNMKICYLKATFNNVFNMSFILLL